MQVEISFEQIKGIQVRTKQDSDGALVSTVSFETKTQPAALARLMALQQQGRHIEAVLWSPQAVFDLDVKQVKVEQPVLKIMTLQAE